MSPKEKSKPPPRPAFDFCDTAEPSQSPPTTQSASTKTNRVWSKTTHSKFRDARIEKSPPLAARSTAHHTESAMQPFVEGMRETDRPGKANRPRRQTADDGRATRLSAVARPSLS